MREADRELMKEVIMEHIRSRGGSIPFDEYMELCLYSPRGGYYQRSVPKLGRDGDFYTSAHIGTVMGDCVAGKLAEAAARLDSIGKPVVIAEWGGGDGRLGAAVLDALERDHPELYRSITYMGVESSPYHRKLQSERLARRSSRLAGIVPPEDPLVERMLSEHVTLIYANELLDAFPVRRFRYCRGEWQEIRVVWEEERLTFGERTAAISDPEVSRWLELHPIEGEEGQCIELGLAGLHWLRRMGRMLNRGFLLLADYGDRSSELYAPYRMDGTLLTYRNHQASGDPYAFPGEQDITAHVNFEWCLEAAAEAGFEELRLQTQKDFLVEQGILQRLQNHSGTDPFSPEARSNRAIRQLLLSDGMSELFKVLTMYKQG